MQAQIEERLQTDGLHCKVYGRLKHLYSIYRKMYAQNKTIKVRICTSKGMASRPTTVVCRDW